MSTQWTEWKNGTAVVQTGAGSFQNINNLLVENGSFTTLANSDFEFIELTAGTDYPVNFSLPSSNSFSGSEVENEFGVEDATTIQSTQIFIYGDNENDEESNVRVSGFDFSEIQPKDIFNKWEVRVKGYKSGGTWFIDVVQVRVNYTETVVNTYYFDGSGGISDPDNAWSNEANAFDGNLDTKATSSVPGSLSSNFLIGNNTNAPSSGGNIIQVRSRMKLVSQASPETTAWNILSEPTGGWSWSHVSSLNAKLYLNEFFPGFSELRCSLSTNSVFEELLNYTGTIQGGEFSAYIIELEVTSEATPVDPPIEETVTEKQTTQDTIQPFITKVVFIGEAQSSNDSLTETREFGRKVIDTQSTTDTIYREYDTTQYLVDTQSSQDIDTLFFQQGTRFYPTAIFNRVQFNSAPFNSVPYLDSYTEILQENQSTIDYLQGFIEKKGELTENQAITDMVKSFVEYIQKLQENLSSLDVINRRLDYIRTLEETQSSVDIQEFEVEKRILIQDFQKTLDNIDSLLQQNAFLIENQVSQDNLERNLDYIRKLQENQSQADILINQIELVKKLVETQITNENITFDKEIIQLLQENQRVTDKVRLEQEFYVAIFENQITDDFVNINVEYIQKVSDTVETNDTVVGLRTLNRFLQDVLDSNDFVDFFVGYSVTLIDPQNTSDFIVLDFEPLLPSGHNHILSVKMIEKRLSIRKDISNFKIANIEKKLTIK